MKAYRAIFAFRALDLYTFRTLEVVGLGWVGISLTRPDETPAFAARPGKPSHLESFSGTGHLLALEIQEVLVPSQRTGQELVNANEGEKFDLNPEQYLGKSAGTPKSGHGCCS
jgi:hypothetical protein